MNTSSFVLFHRSFDFDDGWDKIKEKINKPEDEYMGFIMDFMDGTIEPHERPWNDSLERDKILTEMDEHETFLLNNLTGTAKEHFQKFVAVRDKNLIMVDEAAFVAGFRWGARCMLDILQE